MTRKMLAAGAAALAVASVASAGIAPPESFQIDTFVDGPGFVEQTTDPAYLWGTDSELFADPAFPILVSSGDSNRVGFDYEIVFDFSAYDLPFFGPPEETEIFIDLLSVYDGADLIDDVFVKNMAGESIGDITLVGDDLSWDGTAFDLGNGSTVTIQFSTIPAPGALALLGMGGLVARRRRG